MRSRSPLRRHLQRRHFLKTVVLLPAVLSRARACKPWNRITLGFIGVGSHGLGYNLKTFLQQDDAQVIAVCDVFASRRQEAKQVVDQHYGTTGCREYADFRELLAAPDIDAVVISTPDHWHVPMSIRAIEAGKDVMCEKPTLTIAEGRALADLVQQKQAVYQVGLEDRSSLKYHMIAEWVRNGAIGTLRRMHVKLPGGKAHPLEPAAPVPAELNYDRWLGPAPFAPYSPMRTDQAVWRDILDYSGGHLADWGAHLIDTAQVANFAENTTPVKVAGEGFFPTHSLSTAAIEYKLHYTYANGVEMTVESGGVAIRFEGDDGWVSNTGWLGRFEASDPAILHTKYKPGASRLWPRPPGEHRNFLDCVRSRQPTTYSAEAGHRLSTVMHLGNIAMQLQRQLIWDPVAEVFVNDEAANRMRTRPARTDWEQA